MRGSFKCSFCESNFVEFEEYKTHLSARHPLPLESVGTRRPHSIQGKYLKCETCAFKWLDLKGDSDWRLYSYENKLLCYPCISESKQRKRLIRRYKNYFEKTNTMWEIKDKDLYVKYRGNISCCLCGGYGNSNFHYSLALHEPHRICNLCIEKEWDENIEDSEDEYSDSLISHCDCYLTLYW
jgi:hypothetical protein